jgi:hypothetical protein
MSRNHRRMGGMAVGALLAPPLISLLASPIASAEPTTDVTPVTDVQYTLGPDTLTVNPSDYAFDNYVSVSGYDLDVYAPDGLTSKTYDAVITDPGKFQLDITDTDGVITHTLTTTGIGNPDPGVGDIGGTVSSAAVAAASDVIPVTDLQYTFGPDTLTVNPSDYAFDNFISTSNFDVDLYAPDGVTSQTYDVILTDPGKFQLDLTDVGGTFTHTLTTTDIGNPDPGLGDIGGILPLDVPAGAVGDVAGGGLLESLAGLFGF